MAWSQQHIDAMYGEYDIEMSYIGETGLLVVPHSYDGTVLNAITNPSVSTIHRSHPTSILIINWKASRIGAKPVVPSPYPSRLISSLVLLGQTISPLSSNLESPEGTIVTYCISGTYVYQALAPININANLTGYGMGGAAPPFDSDAGISRGDNYLPSDVDYGNILPI